MRFSRKRRRGPYDFCGGFEELLACAKAGDQTALTALYDNHGAMVYGYFRACGVVDIDDLTSEVFIGMLRNIRRFDGDHTDFRRWLMTIAYRRLVDERRRYFSNKSDLRDPATLETLPTPESVVELQAVTIDPYLADAFAELTDAQREVLALRFVADISLAGVAEITGRPIGAVKSLQNRALTKLRTRLTIAAPDRERDAR